MKFSHTVLYSDCSKDFPFQNRIWTGPTFRFASALFYGSGSKRHSHEWNLHRRFKLEDRFMEFCTPEKSDSWSRQTGFLPTKSQEIDHFCYVRAHQNAFPAIRTSALIGALSRPGQVLVTANETSWPVSWSSRSITSKIPENYRWIRITQSKSLLKRSRSRFLN